MESQLSLDYLRIAEAITYIKYNFKDQPRLEDIAKKVGLSPAHFQRLFTNWAGVSPKKFLQYTTIEYAKKILNEYQSSLFDTAHEIGLSGTSRLYDLFINIEGMTPGEYKNGGKNLSINYNFSESPFGKIIIASTSKGVCYIAFVDGGEQIALETLKDKFPNAKYRQMQDIMQQNALSIFTQDWSKLHQVKLHLKGSDFQLKVWETLLKIPFGKLASYQNIASLLDKPTASRASPQ